MKKTFCDRCEREIEHGIEGAEEIVENFVVGIEILKYADRTAPELCSPCVHALTAKAGNCGSPDPLAPKPSDVLKADAAAPRLDVKG